MMMTDKWLDDVAVRLNKVDQELDPWENDGTVATAKDMLVNDPYIVIAFLLDKLEMCMD